VLCGVSCPVCPLYLQVLYVFLVALALYVLINDLNVRKCAVVKTESMFLLSYASFINCLHSRVQNVSFMCMILHYLAYYVFFVLPSVNMRTVREPVNEKMVGWLSKLL
jgi:hypothetical protein